MLKDFLYELAGMIRDLVNRYQDTEYVTSKDELE